MILTETESHEVACFHDHVMEQSEGTHTSSQGYLQLLCATEIDWELNFNRSLTARPLSVSKSIHLSPLQLILEHRCWPHIPQQLLFLSVEQRSHMWSQSQAKMINVRFNVKKEMFQDNYPCWLITFSQSDCKIDLSWTTFPSDCSSG